MTDRTTMRLYRIIKTDPPTLADFFSNAAKNRILPENATADAARVWDGLSMYDTEGAARRKGRYSPMLGAYIAVVEVAFDLCRVEQTTNNPRHFTVWGEAGTLFQGVVYVVRVKQPAGGGA